DLGERSLVDCMVRRLERLGDTPFDAVCLEIADLRELAHHDLYGHFAGDFTGGVSAHAIGNDEEAALGVRLRRVMVLIAGADHPDIGASSVKQTHYQPSALQEVKCKYRGGHQYRDPGPDGTTALFGHRRRGLGGHARPRLTRRQLAAIDGHRRDSPRALRGRYGNVGGSEVELHPTEPHVRRTVETSFVSRDP